MCRTDGIAKSRQIIVFSVKNYVAILFYKCIIRVSEAIKRFDNPSGASHMTKTIYEQKEAAFPNVSAYNVIRVFPCGNKTGAATEIVATIAIKFPKDGAGRLYAYVHLIGLEMVRAYAGGYGYDKRSAAVCEAASKIKPYELDNDRIHALMMNDLRHEFMAALANIGGKDWKDALYEAGFTVLQAV